MSTNTGSARTPIEQNQPRLKGRSLSVVLRTRWFFGPRFSRGVLRLAIPKDSAPRPADAEPQEECAQHQHPDQNADADPENVG
jgi:hypothetical protein